MNRADNPGLTDLAVSGAGRQPCMAGASISLIGPLFAYVCRSIPP
jgi:hypothetical protein